MEADRALRRADRPFPRAPQGGRGQRRRLPRALPRQSRRRRPRAAPEVRHGDARVDGDGVSDRGRGGRVPRRVASRQGPRRRVQTSRSGAARAAGADRRAPLARSRELGGGRRHDRPIGGRARRAVRAPRPTRAARDLSRLVPLVGLGRRRHRPRGPRRGTRARRRLDRARPPPLSARERRRTRRSARTATGTRRSALAR